MSCPLHKITAFTVIRIGERHAATHRIWELLCSCWLGFPERDNDKYISSELTISQCASVPLCFYRIRKWRRICSAVPHGKTRRRWGGRSMKPIEADIRLGKETETRARAVDPPSRFTCDDARTRGRTHRSLRLHASRAFPQRARRGKVLPIASSSRDLAAATRSLIVEILCTQSGFDRMRERKRERGRGRERERERERESALRGDRSIASPLN